MITDRPLTVAQVADRENVSTKTVLRAIARGDLDAWNVGDPDGSRPTWRIDEASILTWRHRARGRQRHRHARSVVVRPIEAEGARPGRNHPINLIDRGRATVTADMGRMTTA